MPEVYLLTSAQLHSTGHYLGAAAGRSGNRVSMAREGATLPFLGAGDILLYVDPGTHSFPVGIDRLPAVRIAYLIDVHQDIQSRLDIAPLFDLIFIAQCDYVEEFRRQGHVNTHWLPLACDPITHHVSGLARDIDVGFVGQLGPANSSRRLLLQGVLPHYRTNDFRRFYLPSEMGRIYSASKIVFNASVNGDLNMRVFEAMAAGALLITDRIGNGLTQLFTDGEHYIGYSSVEEARDRVSYYLGSGSERKRIARAGQECVISLHTYAHRWRQVEAAAGADVDGGGARRPSLSPKEGALTYGRIFENRADPAGVLRIILSERASMRLGVHFVRALGKAVNRVFPFTPNAIRARLRDR